jgi:hypothetical protein
MSLFLCVRRALNRIVPYFVRSRSLMDFNIQRLSISMGITSPQFWYRRFFLVFCVNIHPHFHYDSQSFHGVIHNSISLTGFFRIQYGEISTPVTDTAMRALCQSSRGIGLCLMKIFRGRACNALMLGSVTRHGHLVSSRPTARWYHSRIEVGSTIDPLSVSKYRWTE